jgi:gamma-glutamyltranspeptidase/glutathione hydrolase
VSLVLSPTVFAQTKPVDMSDPRINQGPKTVATGDRGMVSTQLLSSTEAALRVLKDGGNAVDAAITAMFHQEVADYHMVFLFGSMSALYYDAKTGKTHALVAIGAHPDPDRNAGKGTDQVVIGGTVRGAAALSKRFGSKPWASLVEPAIREAEEGPLVTSYMYGFNFGMWESGFLSDLRSNAEARKFYMPEGHLVGAGQRWRMPALAATLREVAKDPDYMYTGAWAKKFVDAVKKGGMAVTMEDLAEYQPEWTEPVRFSYRGNELHGSPAPDTGGLAIGFNLNVLENFDLPRLGSYAKSAESMEIVARTMARVQKETRGAIRDPLTYNVPGALWLSKDYGRMVAEFVRQTMPKVSLEAKTASAVHPRRRRLDHRGQQSHRRCRRAGQLGFDASHHPRRRTRDLHRRRARHRQRPSGALARPGAASHPPDQRDPRDEGRQAVARHGHPGESAAARDRSAAEHLRLRSLTRSGRGSPALLGRAG